jgi:hypothetical protein
METNQFQVERALWIFQGGEEEVERRKGYEDDNHYTPLQGS